MALFEDVFEVTEIDKEGKRFDGVSRIECRGDEHEDVQLSLDYNSEIYSLKIGNKFDFVLRTSLSDNLETINNDNEWIPNKKIPLLDKYEYVMYGKIFRIQNTKKDVEIYASFGGLLLMLKGDANNFDKLGIDKRLYLLIRKNNNIP
mmetsp:Transcript_42524/g.52354  ORF Transcript_42524/g.52354 Transcript_42524/m.52354 type:complete len:147 (+) Transcript_42524:55-495(+)